MKVWSTESKECIFEKAGLHSMGINDMSFTGNPGEIITCSSDRTAKLWKLDLEAKELTEVRVLNLSESDTQEITDNVEKQLLGVAYDASENLILTTSCNSDINIWSGEETAPSCTLRGHTNTIN